MARNMALSYDGHNYYKKMFELQEKLRKSEEERIRLEERFNVLVRESGNRHNACLNQLRMKYIQYLEEQRTRDERNHKLLAVLDRVMNKLALISAKKDRLNVLRKQYEAYLLRIYDNRQPPGSITGDSGIASQYEDKRPRKNVVVETRNVSSPRTHPTMSPHSSKSRSRFANNLHDQVPVDDVLPIHHPTLPTASPSAVHNIDYPEASVLRTPQVHASPINQSGDQSIYRAHDAHRYPHMTSGFDGDAPPSDLRYLLNHIPHATVSGSAMPVNQAQPNIGDPVNRFFREHVQAASDLSTSARLPAGDATYARHTESEPVPRQFELPTTFSCYDATNVLLSDPQLRMKTVPYDAAAPMRLTSAIAKSNTYRLDSDADRLGSLPGYKDSLTSPKSEDAGSIRSLTSDDVDDLIRRNERLLWRNADVPKTRRSSVMLETNDTDLDENGRTTAILESELDRYISNIRKLHQEHAAQSLEELDHEQNTSGDLLNVSLSEDTLELPAEDRKDRKERIPEEMNKVLELANDLVSKTVESQEAAQLPKQIDNNISSTVVADKIKRSEEISVNNKTRKNNIAMRSTELEQSHRDAENAKTKSADDSDHPTESRHRDHEISGAKKNDIKEELVSSSDDKSRIDDDRGDRASPGKRLDSVIGKESNIEDSFDVTEELAPWDLANVQKQVLELRLDDSEEDRQKKVAETANQSDEAANKLDDSLGLIGQNDTGNSKVEEPGHLPLPVSEEEMKDSNTNGSYERNGMSAHLEETTDVSSGVSSHRETDEAIKTREPIDIPPQIEEQFNEADKKQDSKDTTELRSDGQLMEQDEYSAKQGYIEDPSQRQQYAQQDPNEYNYEQNIPYESATGNEEYERYANQGYAQDGQEYVEYVSEQYEQYPVDPNSQRYQHDPNAQYEQDPNQAYAYNYDPTEGYDPNQQYDPNQGYRDDPNQGYGDDPNQAYDYSGQAYDPNQIYDEGAYEQEYQEERREDNEIVNVGDEEEKPEETLQSPQADSQSDDKKKDDDKLQVMDVVANGTNQSKKKKDVIKSLLDSDTDTTTIERNVSNTESDFDFN